MKHSTMITMAAALSLAATPAMASISASYGSDVRTPPIGDSNDDYTTDTFSIPSGVPTNGSIDHVTWAVGNYGVSNDLLSVQLCTTSSGREQCSSPYTGYKGSSSYFSGWKTSTIFYLKIRSSTPTYERYQTNYTSTQQIHLEVYY